MRRWIALVSLLVAGCAATIPTDYAGADAGYVVIGMGFLDRTPYSPVRLKFRRPGQEGEGEFFFTNYSGGPFPGSRADYRTGDESGAVQVARLAPGRYEIFNFDARFGSPLGDRHYRARQPFSIAFDVRPNDVVYLGNFQVNPIRMTASEGRALSGDAGVFFVVEDRSQADLSFAKARVPALALERARNATPDVEVLGNPLLIPPSRAKAAREKARSKLD